MLDKFMLTGSQFASLVVGNVRIYRGDVDKNMHPHVVFFCHYNEKMKIWAGRD